MSQKVYGVLLQLELLEHVSHWSLCDVDVFPSLGVVEIHILNVEVETPASLLFKETHQRRS